MLKHEFDERVKTSTKQWEYEVIEQVYNNHTSIPDVGGKDIIAKIYIDKGMKEIIRMFREDLGRTDEIITRTNEDEYTSWDVNYEGYVKNEKPKTIESIFAWLTNEFKTKYPEIWETVDYFSDMTKYGENNLTHWPMNYRWISVYYVRGGSEGYYIHVDYIEADTGARHLMFMAKTLCNRETGEKICNALARILEV